MDRTKPSAQSHIGVERVAIRSRPDHERTCEKSKQVNAVFDGRGETGAPACRRDSNHVLFVS